MIDLSLNEVETIAAKAARGAGFSWGLADEIGRAARFLASQGADWGGALLSLAGSAKGFDSPTAERVALWRRGERDGGGARPLCPVRTAALLLDDAASIRGALRICNVGLPLWLAAMLAGSGWTVEAGQQLDACDVTIRPGAATPVAMGARRAIVAPQILAALNVYAARTYVPESERSRKLGAGGGTVDDD